MKILKTILLSAVMLTTVIAGDRNNPRGVGMARTVNATALGIEALNINPALLALPGNRFLDIGLIPFSFHVRTELFSYDIYQKYFTGVEGPTGGRVSKVLTTADKDELLSLIPDNAGTWTNFDFTSVAIAIENEWLGGIGFSITDHIGLKTQLSRDFFRMALFGLDSAGSEYNFGGTDINAWWWREYNFTYARKIPIKIPVFTNIYAGVSYKMIRGYGMFETVEYNTVLGNRLVGNQYELHGNANFLVRRSGTDLFDENSDADPTPFPEPAGKGSAWDVGLSAQIGTGIRVSASIVNMGTINWEENLVQTSGHGSIDISNPFSVEGTDSLEETLQGRNEPGTAFSTALPTQIRFGIAMRSDQVAFLQWLPGRMLIAADYTQGMNESLGNTMSPRFSVGMEYRLIPLLPIRTGISIGGDDSFRWAAGMGLDFHVVQLDFATENIGLLFSPDNFQMFQFSFGMRLKI
jgi:hypothetical protein